MGALPTVLSTKIKIDTACVCGEVKARRVADLIKKPALCKSCTALAVDSIARTAAYRLANKYGTEVEKRFAGVLSGAKKRCENPNTIGYGNYGGRGIKFNFNSVREGVAYLLTLPSPKPTDTLDRKDNNGHYEKGNLRWASRTTQRLNQRETRRDNRNVTRLHAQRPDVHRETIRRWVSLGWTDNKILTKKKGSHESLRHS